MSETLKKTNNNRINKAQFTAWLNTAIPFSVWRWSNKKHVIEARDHISALIGEAYRYSRDKAKDEDMLLVFLVNLWVGFCKGCPIQISRNKNKYSRTGIYGRVFFTFERTDRILVKLERMGFLQRSIGYFFEEDKKETRIWATEKLIRLFVDYHFQPVGDVFTLKKEDLVQLREEFTKKIPDKKRPGKFKKIKYYEEVQFEDTDATLGMKNFLERYNALAQKNRLSVKLEGEDQVSLSVLIDSILEGFCTGSIKLVKADLMLREPAMPETYRGASQSSASSNPVGSPVSSVFTDIPGLQITCISHNKFSYPTIQTEDDTEELINIDALFSSITNTLYSQQWQCFQPESTLFLYLFYIKKLFNLIKFTGRTKAIRDRKRNQLLKETRPLADFGIKHLEFDIEAKYLHRVFNRGDKEFRYGGRFYGSFYQGISGDVRSKILINGNETVEIDYSGLHIRMLYHELGLEFTDDPYTVGDGSLRDEYKLVSLISINAKRQGAHVAVRDALKDAGFDVADDMDAVQRMMKDFQRLHEPISEFLFSGAGITLQNKDSQIMEGILKELHAQGICGLPIHDSVVVERKHKEFLWKLMEKKYWERMGFKPVLKPEYDVL